MADYIIGDGTELYRVAFSETDAEVLGFPYKGFREGKNFHWLYYRITHSKKLGYPFYNSWNRYVVNKYGIKSGDTVVILNNAVWSYKWNNGIIKELKKKNCKIVILMVDSMCFFDGSRLERITEAISLADKVFTFDAEDSKQYGWEHTYSYYSKINDIKPGSEKSDVFCSLYSGNRLKPLTEIYDYLSNRGVKCSFYISGIDDAEKSKYFRDEIVYNNFLSYRDIISRDLSSNVILELAKTNQRGNTMRAFEAVVYNKRLLTNNPVIKDFPYYDERYMKYFRDIDDLKKIDKSFFASDFEVNYNYRGDFSPTLLFDKIKQI